MTAYIKMFSRFQDSSFPLVNGVAQKMVSPLMKPKSSKILLIDDDHIFSVVVSDMLMKAGYEVTTALSGREALELLRSNDKNFDVIVLDRMMPELSGLDVLGKITLMPQLKDIPVIMLTSHAGKAQIQTAQDRGIFSLLYKPVDNQLLTSTVKRAIKENQKKQEEAWN